MNDAQMMEVTARNPSPRRDSDSQAPKINHNLRLSLVFIAVVALYLVCFPLWAFNPTALHLGGFIVAVLAWLIAWITLIYYYITILRGPGFWLKLQKPFLFGLLILCLLACIDSSLCV